MKIERFEDIKAWQEARELVRMSYISQENFEKIYDRADKVSRMLSNFIKYLKARPTPQRDPRDEPV
jgi:benzoyl-CoA reductase/2-hydroxyglutaryl-CoA dehydratase subunit BcrC/BadD/HgdB